MNILVAYPSRPSFVARDIKILSSQYQVKEHQFFSPSLSNQVRGLQLLAKADLLYLWFASVRALPLILAATVMGKKVVTVVGGYEAANCPEINYGSARTGRQRWLTRRLLSRSDAILAVSISSTREIVENLGLARERITTIPHGFEEIPAVAVERKNCVLTVGMLAAHTWRRKGVVDFVRSAERMPDVPFIHIGDVPLDVQAIWGKPLPANLEIRGRVSDGDLIRAMYSAKVYLQLSRHEAFGCSVAEAMLCGCIPVVSDRFALPEVVAEAGVVVNPDDVVAVDRAIRLALAADQTSALSAQQRIGSAFSYSAREKKVLEAIAAVSAQN